MNKIVSFIGRPGFGKSTLASLYCKNSDNGIVFHIGMLLKKPEEFDTYITIEEIDYIKKMRSVIEKTITSGKLCEFNRINQIALQVITGLALQHTVYLDGFPRSKIQAELLFNECKKKNIHLLALNLSYKADDSFQDMLSFHYQYQRDLDEKKRDPFDSITRYTSKLAVYNSETLSALHYLKNTGVPIKNVYIGHNNVAIDSTQFPFSHIINKNTFAKYFGNEFYFYPIRVSEYAAFYTNYTLNKFPLMVTITLTNKCTDNCVGCFNSKYNSNDYIDINILEKLVDELSNNGTLAIKVAGREPTCYPHLGRFLKKCKERHLLCVVITSGANLDVWENELYEYCDHLRVSLNAYSENSHLRYHRPTKEAIPFKTRLQILERLSLQRRKRGLTTGVSFLVRDNNEDELQLLINHCKQIGIDYLRFSQINYFSGKNIGNQEFITKMEKQSTNSFYIKYHEQYVSDCEIVKDSYFACPAILSRSVILANGDVVSCHGSLHLSQYGYNSVYGNINTDSFKNIWCGYKRKSFITNITSELYDNFLQNEEYSCINTKHCVSCKYSGFNHINRWIINNGSNIYESYWDGILYE